MAPIYIFIYLFNKNKRGYDFGCYFAQMMFDNNSNEKYPFFKYNYDFYPSKEQQMIFLTAYRDKFKELIHSSNKCHYYFTENEQDFDLSRLYLEANCFALASLLFYSLRAIYQLHKKYGYPVRNIIN